MVRVTRNAFTVCLRISYDRVSTCRYSRSTYSVCIYSEIHEAIVSSRWTVLIFSPKVPPAETVVFVLRFTGCKCSCSTGLGDRKHQDRCSNAD